MRQILGDGEELRRRHARGHGLSSLHHPVDDDAVDWRADIGPVEIDAGAVQSGLALGERRLGVVDLRGGSSDVGLGAQLGGECGVDGGLGGGALGDELLGTGKIELGLVQIGCGPLHARLLQGDIGLGDGDPRFLLAHRGLKGGGFYAGEDLAPLDRRAEINIELADLARDLRAHVHGDERAHSAGGGDNAPHVGACGRHGLDVELPRRGMLQIIVARSARQTGDEKYRQPTRAHRSVRIPSAIRS